MARRATEIYEEAGYLHRTDTQRSQFGPSHNPRTDVRRIRFQVADSEPPRVSERVRATARPALSERLQRTAHGPAGRHSLMKTLGCLH
jgi:hypothetical protein